MTPRADMYVPILKLKRGEKTALGAISAGLRSGVIPLLEVVERTDKPLHEHLRTAFAGLTNHMKGYARCFLDAREIAADGPAGAAEAFARAASAGIPFTPVTGISRDTDVTAALAHGQRGLALRLTRPEFEKGVFPAGIESFLYQHSVSAGGVDLIVDLGVVEDMISDGVATLTKAFLETVPNHAQWRTFTVSACAFPLTMGIVDTHGHELVERTDWISWKENLYNRRSKLVRLPNFSDCVIQHPRGVEGFDPRTMSMSASIRYARENDWLLIKGREHPVDAGRRPVSGTRDEVGLRSSETVLPGSSRALRWLRGDAEGGRWGTGLRGAGGLAPSRHNPPYVAGHAEAQFACLALRPARTASAISSRLKRSQTRSQMRRRDLCRTPRAASRCSRISIACSDHSISTR